MAKKEMIGKRFGWYTVIAEGRHTENSIYWLCKCDCGVTAEIRGDRLRRGEATRCRQHDTERKTVHGYYGTATYRTWNSMKQRCLNPNSPDYPHYGGRGIKICANWLEFTGFLKDMGERPRGKCIERVDNDGNYEPTNCVWATPKEQAQNFRRSQHVTIGERTQTFAAWCDEFGLPRTTGHTRLSRGWSELEALITPVRGQK